MVYNIRSYETMGGLATCNYLETYCVNRSLFLLKKKGKVVMEKYLNKLIEQFASARGIKHIDVNSENFINEFCQWIKENKLTSGKYLALVSVISNLSIEAFSFITYDVLLVMLFKSLPHPTRSTAKSIKLIIFTYFIKNIFRIN